MTSIRNHKGDPIGSSFFQECLWTKNFCQLVTQEQIFHADARYQWCKHCVQEYFHETYKSALCVCQNLCVNLYIYIRLLQKKIWWKTNVPWRTQCTLHMCAHAEPSFTKLLKMNALQLNFTKKGCFNRRHTSWKAGQKHRTKPGTFLNF